MNSPHLPDSPRPFPFRIRPFHVTLAVVIAIHIVAFLLFFRGEKPGGAASATSADHKAKLASVTWQHIDSMIPAHEVEAPLAPAAAPLPAVDTSLLAQGDSAAPADVLPAVAAAPSVPEFGMAEVAATPPAESLPILAATAVEGSVGSVPGAPSAGTGTGFGDGANAGFDFGAYDLLITKEFHRAWEQPLGIDTPFRQNTAKLSVRIGRDGTVERFSLARLTGVPELDSSVLAAARSVRRIAPLPDDFHGEAYEVMINFQLD